jgi:hypothetical protein
MIGALERFEENHQVDLAAVETYERWRVTARDTKGRVMKGNSKPFVAPELPEGGVSEEPCKRDRKDSSCLRQHAAGSIKKRMFSLSARSEATPRP